MSVSTTSFTALKDTLDELVGQFEGNDEVPTEELVDGYAAVKSVVKEAGKVQDSLKAKLLDRLDDGFEDSKGNILLRGWKSAVEARPRVSTKFNEERARLLLSEHGLLRSATAREVVVKNPVQLVDAVEKALDLLIQLGKHVEANELEDAIAEATEVREVVKEDLVEGLVRKGALSLAVAEKMFDVTRSYALYDAK